MTTSAVRKCVPALLAVVVGIGLATSPAWSQGAATAAVAPVFKKSAPADKRAFEAARATEDADAKVDALRAFERAYPDSHLVQRAQWEIFSTLTKRLPRRVEDIRQQARQLIGHDDKGLGGVYARAEVADALANAGVALPDAEQWAGQAASALTEAQWLRWNQAEGKPAQDRAARAQSLREFAETRAEVLTAQANVYWREGKAAQAQAALREAAALDPAGDEVNALQGEVALAAHHDAEALDYFERGQLAGELQPHQRELLLALYRKAHGGSLDGLQQALDARYASLFPSPIPVSPKSATAGNRAVLVELFTGAGCPPCTAADLALEGAAANYSRKQVVVLAFDQHIPRPDPLATPQTVARGKWYAIAGTPTFFVDGAEAKIDGGSRAQAPGTYAQLSRQIDARLRAPAPLALQATATLATNGTVQVQASEQATGAAGPEVHVALVEDRVRYSGENGVRFHEAVVRALADATGDGAALRASFDLPAIEAGQRAYLDGYEQHNDRYGPIHFLSKDTHLDRGKLAVVVFAQDPASKAILQSAFVPLAGG